MAWSVYTLACHSSNDILYYFWKPILVIIYYSLLFSEHFTHTRALWSEFLENDLSSFLQKLEINCELSRGSHLPLCTQICIPFSQDNVPQFVTTLLGFAHLCFETWLFLLNLTLLNLLCILFTQTYLRYLKFLW